MNKNLIAEGQAYMHLYLGQKFIYKVEGHEWSEPMELTADQLSVYYRLIDDPETQHKLILRPLQAMTDEEKHELFKYIWPNDHAATPLGQEYCINYALDIGDDGDQIDNWMEDAAATINNTILWSRITLWLTSKGFDLFELINTGFAIDSTKRVGGN